MTTAAIRMGAGKLFLEQPEASWGRSSELASDKLWDSIFAGTPQHGGKGKSAYPGRLFAFPARPKPSHACHQARLLKTEFEP